MVYLSQSIIAPLKSSVEKNAEECCGFLLGAEIDENRIISMILQVENDALDRRTTFRISSKNYLAAENFATWNNLQLIGIYHSHPNSPAIPSEFDRVAAQPYFSYVILSVMNKKVEAIRSWNLNNKFQFEEEPLFVLDMNHDVYGYRNHPNPAA